MAQNGDSPEQLTLLRETVRRSRTKEPAGITSTLPIAQVAVDMPLPHLDRPFDYLVPDDLADAAQPGARVKVRFAGKDLDGFVLRRLEASDHDGKLARIRKVVSPEQVLTPEVADLCRAVADRYAGVFADVTRLAVPPRHAKVEAEPLKCSQPVRPVESASRSEWSQYPVAGGFLDALTRSEAPAPSGPQYRGPTGRSPSRRRRRSVRPRGVVRCCSRRMRVTWSVWPKPVPRCSGGTDSSRSRLTSARPRGTGRS